MTAGLAAHFIKLGQLNRIQIDDKSPQGIKRLIIDNAYSRSNSGRSGIYNLANPDSNEQFCEWNFNPNPVRKLRRDDDAQCLAPFIPFASLEAQPPVCHDEANFPGQASISGSQVSASANSFRLDGDGVTGESPIETQL